MTLTNGKIVLTKEERESLTNVNNLLKEINHIIENDIDYMVEIEDSDIKDFDTLSNSIKLWHEIYY